MLTLRAWPDTKGWRLARDLNAPDGGTCQRTMKQLPCYTLSACLLWRFRFGGLSQVHPVRGRYFFRLIVENRAFLIHKLFLARMIYGPLEPTVAYKDISLLRSFASTARIGLGTYLLRANTTSME